MEIITISLYLLGGLIILSYGANLFVESASRIARYFGISPLIIGLTVVSLGTSAPEFAVNILAAYQGNTDIVLGNVIGSNIFNVAVIIGICATLSPLFISRQLLRIDIPIMILISALAWIICYDGKILIFESVILCSSFVTYILIQIKLSKSEKSSEKDEYQTEYSEKGKPFPEAIKLLVGLGLLVAGAKLFVDGAISGARFLGWSEAVIALTIISAGTSLPEVATSVAATLKGEKDIAVGNVVGSNIFNIAGVLGLSGIFAFKEIAVNSHIREIDLPLMVVLMALCFPLALLRQQFDRWIGPLFILVYCVYTWHLLS